MDNIYGNQCGSDNAFTRKARLLQYMYRVETDEAGGALCGVGGVGDIGYFRFDYVVAL